MEGIKGANVQDDLDRAWSEERRTRSPEQRAVQLLEEMIGCFPVKVEADWVACETLEEVIT
jgi:hypothetical protein